MMNQMNPYTDYGPTQTLVPTKTGLKYDALRFAIDAARAGACRGAALIETAREIEAYLTEAPKQ